MGSDPRCVVREMEAHMQVHVQFHSYFKDLTGCVQTRETIPPGATLDALHDQLTGRFPRLATMKKSTLFAVGVDYQPRDYVLRDGDEVSLFPPVQGG
jgi:molybdopterin converting factor small subunit